MMISMTQQEVGDVLAEWATQKYGTKFNRTHWYMERLADGQTIIEIDFQHTTLAEARKQAGGECEAK